MSEIEPVAAAPVDEAPAADAPAEDAPAGKKKKGKTKMSLQDFHASVAAEVTYQPRNAGPNARPSAGQQFSYETQGKGKGGKGQGGDRKGDRGKGKGRGDRDKPQQDEKENEEDAQRKEYMRIKKTLRDIAKLEEKQQLGEQLAENQMQKLSRKHQLEEELAKLPVPPERKEPEQMPPVLPPSHVAHEPRRADPRRAPGGPGPVGSGVRRDVGGYGSRRDVAPGYPGARLDRAPGGAMGGDYPMGLRDAPRVGAIGYGDRRERDGGRNAFAPGAPCAAPGAPVPQRQRQMQGGRPGYGQQGQEMGQYYQYMPTMMAMPVYPMYGADGQLAPAQYSQDGQQAGQVGYAMPFAYVPQMYGIMGQGQMGQGQPKAEDNK